MKMKALIIIEDDGLQLNLLKEILSPEYETVDIFRDPVSALKQLKQKTYDLIIVDMKMPGMSGKEFIRRVRKKDLFYGPVRKKDTVTPILVYTGYSDECDDFMDSMSGKRVYILQKPQPSYALKQYINMLLDD